jgi:hypothetical protein
LALELVSALGPQCLSNQSSSGTHSSLWHSPDYFIRFESGSGMMTGNFSDWLPFASLSPPRRLLHAHLVAHLVGYRSPERLRLHLELYRSYYHFVRPRASLTVAKCPRTPAMAAGLTDHRWTIQEWLTRPVYAGSVRVRLLPCL